MRQSLVIDCIDGSGRRTVSRLRQNGQAFGDRVLESRIPPQKRVAIVQSSYIPWKGYFDLIRAVDEFILLDEVQFTKRDWRSRNRIKTKDGLAWLSIPVQTKGRFHQTIRETEISDSGWAEGHWRSISTHYAKTPH